MVKSFILRVARNCLPTNENLLSRGVQVIGSCDICKIDYENMWHLFIECPYAKGCWEAAGNSNIIRQAAELHEEFVGVLFHVIEHAEDENKASFCMLLWHLWKEINGVIWKGSYPNCYRTVESAHNYHQEWLSCRTLPADLSHRRCNLGAVCKWWHNLMPGWVKCEVDAAFFPNLNATVVGMIIRDATGNFVAARVACFPGCWRVEEREAMGILEALSSIKQLDLVRVEIVSDCSVAIKAIYVESVDRSELGSIALSCRRILDTNICLKIKHVFREANFVAHRLAKHSKYFQMSFVWDEPPTCVEGLLDLPCSCL